MTIKNIMGEIADDMVNGACCSLCGLYFIKEKNITASEGVTEKDVMVLFEHGYPVVCKECYTPDCGYEKAIAETV